MYLEDDNLILVFGAHCISQCFVREQQHHGNCIIYSLLYVTFIVVNLYCGTDNNNRAVLEGLAINMFEVLRNLITLFIRYGTSRIERTR